MLTDKRPRLGEWTGKKTNINKVVMTLSAGYGIDNRIGRMTFIAPFDGKMTQMTFQSPQEQKSLDWRTGFGYQLNEQASFGGSTEDTTFLMVKFPK